jgi:hypothetical protein
MSYDNTNAGIISRNERKEKDTHPDFSGTINVDGIEYWLSGWTKEGRAGSKMEGRKYLSLSVRRKDNQPAASPSAAPAPAAKGSGFDDMDDDIPF